MNISCKRREFLRHLAVLGVAGTLPGWGFPSVAPIATPRPKKIMLQDLTLDDFSPYLNTRFTLELEPGRCVELKLVEASSLAAGAGPRPTHLAPRAPFSILFLAPGNAPIGQRIYRIQHPAMGEFEIFLVPIGRDQRGLVCEAVFN